MLNKKRCEKAVLRSRFKSVWALAPPITLSRTPQITSPVATSNISADHNKVYLMPINSLVSPPIKGPIIAPSAPPVCKNPKEGPSLSSGVLQATRAVEAGMKPLTKPLSRRSTTICQSEVA